MESLFFFFAIGMPLKGEHVAVVDSQGGAALAGCNPA